MDSNVVKWLFLPDHLTPPNPLFLLCKIIIRNEVFMMQRNKLKPLMLVVHHCCCGLFCFNVVKCDETVVFLTVDVSDDFLLLLGASLQLQVFEEELQHSVQILAGDNCEMDGEEGEVSDHIRQLHLNTVPDFMMCRLTPTAHLSVSILVCLHV